MVTVTVNIRNPEFRQHVIFETVNCWLPEVTRDHLEAAQRYLDGDAHALEAGDPPVIQTMTALANGYWYIDANDRADQTTHPSPGPVMYEGGTGWEYECFWVHEDDFVEHTLADLGEGAGSIAEACRWFLSAWKAVRG